MDIQRKFLIWGFVIQGIIGSPFAYDREYGGVPAGLGVVSIISTLLLLCCCIVCCAWCISCCVAGNRNDENNTVYVIHSPPSTQSHVSPHDPSVVKVVKVTEYHIKSRDDETPLSRKSDRPVTRQPEVEDKSKNEKDVIVSPSDETSSNK